MPLAKILLSGQSFKKTIIITLYSQEAAENLRIQQ